MQIGDELLDRAFLFRSAFEQENHVVDREIVRDRAPVVLSVRLAARISGQRHQLRGGNAFADQLASGLLRTKTREAAGQQQHYDGGYDGGGVDTKHQGLLRLVKLLRLVTLSRQSKHKATTLCNNVRLTDKRVRASKRIKS